MGNGTFGSLVNSAGATTAASLTVSGSTNNYSVANVPATGDGSMMQGYLDNSPGNIISMAFSGLTAAGFARYNVYVYFDGDTTNNRVGQYSIGSTSVFGNDTANFSGTFTQVPLSSNADLGTSTPSGNYIVFPDVAGDAFTLTATVGTAGDGVQRAPINGVQIVTVPEPGHLLFMIAVTCGGLRAWNRRKSPN
jgi:hypothetical protein